MTFLIESLISCALFTLFVFLMSRNPIKSIFNYPPAIIPTVFWSVAPLAFVAGIASFAAIQEGHYIRTRNV